MRNKIFHIINIVFLSSLFIFTYSCSENPNIYYSGQVIEEPEILYREVLKNDYSSSTSSHGLDDYSRLYAIQPDGSNKRLISDEIWNCSSAKYSPLKTYIIASGRSPQGETTKLHLFHNDGHYLRKLNFKGFRPVWYPDENKIYFITVESYRTNIHSIDIIGENHSQETFVDSTEFGLINWSMNGDYLYYLERIWSINNGRINRSDAKLSYFNRFLNQTGYYQVDNNQIVRACISSNYDKFAYIAGGYQNRDIYIYDIYTKTTTNLTNSPAEYREIAWSPNDSEIAYSIYIFPYPGGVNFGSDIYKVNIITNEIQQLTYTGIDSIYNTILDWK